MHAASAAPAASPTGSGRAIRWISGLIALAALAACLIMPIRVFTGGVDNYAVNLASTRTWLIVPTLIYFVAGTTFYYQWRKGTATV